MDNESHVPQPPKFSAEDIERCRANGEFRPILFEWYKYVGLISNFLARIRRDSPDLKEIPKLHYAALVGLLNRCSRLMLANVRLSHDGYFGETTAIIDRCIFESALKVIWLCLPNNTDGFQRFIADGLKTEVAFKEKIGQNITDEERTPSVIEQRMLRSIERYFARSNLNETEIRNTPRVPDEASIINAIGYDKTLYIVGQRLGSHHVHGTWPSLLLHYLVEENGEFAPRDHNCETHINQYFFVPRIVLDSGIAFVRFTIREADSRSGLELLLDSVQKEIKKLLIEVDGKDFEKAEQI